MNNKKKYQNNFKILSPSIRLFLEIDITTPNSKKICIFKLMHTSVCFKFRNTLPPGHMKFCLHTFKNIAFVKCDKEL
jgi:hypothetical protein